MKFIIKKEIFNHFKDFITGVILIKKADNKRESPEINEILRDAENKAINDFSQFESPSRHPNIIPWRQAYKKFGSDPHAYRCSSEALVRQVLKGNKIRHINKLVDLYNYISLKYIIPVGGEDLAKVKGDLVLDFARGDEPFVRLGGTENESPLSGEVVYKDEEGVLCRRWNWREADRTKLTEDTKNAVIVVEGLLPIQKETIETATKELADLIKKYCGGEIYFEILDNTKKEMVSKF